MNHATGAFQPLQADDPLLVAGYRLVARLGAGGMGRVYLSHTQGGRPVAVKVVRPELADDPDFLRRFRREIKAARRVKGAYTAELIDADADGVPPWLATLYVPGPSLTEAVARRGPLPVPAVLWLMAGVAEALQAVHGAGIVHRDLKPSNVLLAADGPRVIDFGISLASDATWRTATGSSAGTPLFMAPEQASGGEATAATDVFSLGQTAAFAALGEPLYGDGPAATVLYRIVHERPDLSPLPDPLRPLIARCLAADPRERATPAEVVEWCRRQLGPDADAGAGPAVWQEVTGPEVTVPAPAPDPASAYTMPVTAWQQPSAAWQQPVAPGPEERRSRRRRVALTAAAGVTAGALLLAGSVWTVMNVTDRTRHRDTAADPASAPSGSARSSASSSPASGTASEKASGTRGGAAGSSDPSSVPASPRAASGAPRAVPYAGKWLDADNSLSLGEQVDRKDRKGDVRFTCEVAGCALESDTSVFFPMDGLEEDITYDLCSFFLKSRNAPHDLSLAAMAKGSRFCVKNSDGDVALFVIQEKSTAMPDLGFVTLDMTVWRADRP
ncbi:serine/threonine-protein kinase [Streptomyces minutiscleroticus]|uniref:serine/threonine-protein kinase n=1 Tax=Streptomyces minutiscleroticus TaxID=68238 RepID=UPI0033169713